MNAGKNDVDAILADEIHQAARGPVDAASIALWCAAVRDANPRHWGDPQAVIAPPAMIGTWTQRPPWTPTSAPSRSMELHHRLKSALDLPNAVVKTVSHTYGAPVRCWDVITALHRISALGEPRTSRLGVGRDWTVRVVYRNQRGELVAVEDWQFHGYRRDDKAEQDPAPRKPRPSTAEPGVDSSNDRVLPDLTVPVTDGLVIQTAAASGDWTPFHHDREHARRIGLPDIILNTPGHLALMSRWLDESVAPGARPVRLSLQLRASAVPGNTLSFGGRMASRETVDGRWQHIGVKVEERLGDRVASTGDALVVVGASSRDDPWDIPLDTWLDWADTGEPLIDTSTDRHGSR